MKKSIFAKSEFHFLKIDSPISSQNIDVYAVTKCRGFCFGQVRPEITMSATCTLPTEAARGSYVVNQTRSEGVCVMRILPRELPSPFSLFSYRGILSEPFFHCFLRVTDNSYENAIFRESYVVRRSSVHALQAWR